ncbi:MAG TPA: hypothetical protein VMI92_00755 [Steroidobacteraceae bacterium]|nr:hypothetical protein [Steroidobacteraceae bacterium]
MKVTGWVMVLVAMLAALATMPRTARAAGSLVFMSGFESSTAIGAATNCFTSPSACWQSISGSDGTSGYSWPPQFWGTQNAYDNGGLFLAMADVAGVTSSTIGDYVSNRIMTVKGHAGSSSNQALFMQIIANPNGQNELGTAATQDELNFLPASENGDLYISYWIRFQPGMTENMTALDTSVTGVAGNGGTWRNIFALMTGSSPSVGDISPNNGDYRMAAYVLTGCPQELIDAMLSPCTGTNPNPGPFWEFIGDNVAGGGYSLVNHWVETNASVAVPDDGSWNKIEVFWHRSSGSDGRFWMAINGTQLVDHSGPNMGASSLPINRILPAFLASGGYHPIYQWIDDMQIWDGGFPPSSCTVGTDAWCDPPYASH